jgi:ribosomal protein S18 acetylase RimI-like enzyme
MYETGQPMRPRVGQERAAHDAGIIKMSNIRFRHADEQDSKSISYFVKAMLKEMESMGGYKVNPDAIFWDNLHEKINKSIKDVNRLYLFGQIENELIGFVEGRIHTLFEVFAPKKVFHISSIYVVPDRRGKGIAASLMKKALNWASEQGCEQADLNVLINNNAKGLYEKLGFKVFQQEMRLQLPTN